MAKRQPSIFAAVIAALELHAETSEQDAIDVRAAVTTIRRVAGVPGRATKTPRAPRVAAGSLDDRILTLAMDPVSLATLLDQANARKGDVSKRVKALVAAGQLTQIGKSRGTRYQAKS